MNLSYHQLFLRDEYEDPCHFVDFFGPVGCISISKGLYKDYCGVHSLSLSVCCLCLLSFHVSSKSTAQVRGKSRSQVRISYGGWGGWGGFPPQCICYYVLATRRGHTNEHDLI
jgi:hypothetical protein